MKEEIQRLIDDLETKRDSALRLTRLYHEKGIKNFEHLRKREAKTFDYVIQRLKELIERD